MFLLFGCVLGVVVGLRWCFGSLYARFWLVVGYRLGVVGASFVGSVVVPDFYLCGNESASASEGSDGEVWVLPV